VLCAFYVRYRRTMITFVCPTIRPVRRPEARFIITYCAIVDGLLERERQHGSKGSRLAALLALNKAACRERRSRTQSAKQSDSGKRPIMNIGNRS
jgi:hypothetical protein